MEKNILIIGAARSGKTTLAKKFVKEKGCSLVSIDNIVSGFESYPEVGIHHDGNDVEVSAKLAPFLIKYFVELSEGNAFYDGIKSVIEGTHIDFEQLIPFLQSKDYKEKYEVIGLTYNHISEDDLYNAIKKYDTEDDWTFWCDDEELRGNVRYFLERNKWFNDMFKKYNITTYDTSYDREEILSEIVKSFGSKGLK